MNSEWYITFHGGTERTALNNVHVYSANGKEQRKALDLGRLPAGIELRELRSLAFGPDGALYVSNAFQDYSQILRFEGELDKHDQHDFRDIFVQFDRRSNPGLNHPFSITFDLGGDLYVSSQNTNLVLRYHGPLSTSGMAGTPMPLPPALGQIGNVAFAPGTFCGAANQVASGLTVVRKALFGHGVLYVADRDASRVKRFDTVTGNPLASIRAKGLIDLPIHLALDGDFLYIGNRGNESVVKFNARTETVEPFIEPKAGGLKNPAGLAIGTDGYLYVASRGSRQVLRYRLEDGRPDRRPFIDALADEPEFLERIDQRPRRVH